MYKRVFDFTLALALLLILFIPALLIAICIKMTSKGPVIHWSRRVGQYNQIFLMPKFRSMKINTPQLATHLMTDTSYITPVGSFLRRSSLDELPQLWSILKGEMSFVGPRPALFNQDDLVSLRSDRGIDQLKPGVTGWAQVNGRDELSVPEKVKFEAEYCEKRSFLFDILIILKTVKRVPMKMNVSH